MKEITMKGSRMMGAIRRASLFLASPALLGAPAWAEQNLREQSISIEADDAMLAATLSLPAGKGPFPAVVFSSVAGPNDRDQTVGNNAGFRELAPRS